MTPDQKAHQRIDAMLSRPGGASRIWHCALALFVTFAIADAATKRRIADSANAANAPTWQGSEIAPINYTPHAPPFEVSDTVKFFASIFTNDLKKSEFESKAEYRARMDAITPTNIVFLEVDTNLVMCAYNAEDRGLVVMLPGEHRTLSTNDPSFFEVSQFMQHAGETVLHNLYGARFAVNQYVGFKYQLAVTNFWGLPFNTRWKNRPDLGVGLPMIMDRSVAKELVPNKHLTLLLGLQIGVGDPAHTFHHVSSTRRETFGKRENAMVFVLNSRIVYVGILNKQSGQILAAWPLSK